MPDSSYVGYARPTEDAWQATCADLDIVVHGRSFDEVYGRLVSAVSGHQATSGDPESGRNPVLERIGISLGRWRWRWLIAWVARSRPEKDGSFRVHTKFV